MSAGDWIILSLVLLGAVLALRQALRHHGCGCGECGGCTKCDACKNHEKQG